MSEAAQSTVAGLSCPPHSQMLSPFRCKVSFPGRRGLVIHHLFPQEQTKTERLPKRVKRQLVVLMRAERIQHCRPPEDFLLCVSSGGEVDEFGRRRAVVRAAFEYGANCAVPSFTSYTLLSPGLVSQLKDVALKYMKVPQYLLK